ncbi:MAG: hypothetical protein IT379_03125 [Deltaproteobacteria bacterium]|nr:hypothetical protein [Deltaproteobacteria bacterium]
MSQITGATTAGLAIVHPENDTTAGAHQRLRMFVPTANTTMLLGKRKADDSQVIPDNVKGKIGYTGVNFITVEHIYVSSSQQTVSIQGEQRVLLQSIAAPLTAISKNLAFVGSTNQALVAGKAGLALYGGKGPVPTRIADTADEVPVPPKLMDLARIHDSPKEALDDVATPVCDEIEGDADALEIVTGAARMAETIATGIEADIAGTGTADDEVTGELTHAYSRDPKKAGVALHGEAHVSLSSDADFQASALGNVGVIAKGSFSAISTDRSEVSSKTFAFLAGGTGAAVMGGDVVAVVSKDDSTLAAREGKTNVFAPEIIVGLLADAGAQKKTDSIAASADATILLDCEDELTVDGKNKVLVTSTDTVLIEVGSYSIEVKTDKITIKGSSPTITLEDSGITLEMGGASVTLENSKVENKMGGSSVECASSGVTIKGSQIKLG